MAPRNRYLSAGLLFAMLVAFYASTSSFRDITDTDLNSLQTRALALHGDVELSRYRLDPAGLWVNRQGSRYSIYGVGVSLPAVPIYAVLARVGASDRVLQAAASIPFVAAAIALMYLVLLRWFAPRVAIVGALLLAFGTTLWPVAAMGFFQNGPTVLFIAIGLAGLFSVARNGPALAGAGFAAATFVRPQGVIALILAGAFYLISERASVLRYVAGAMPFLAGILIQNRWIWGSWLSGGYFHSPVGFHASVPHALWGLLFGWWRGIFVYSPVLIIAAAGLRLALKQPRAWLESRLILLGAISIGTILFYARFTTWYGGLNQFGYRYLIDIVPFLTILVVYAIDRTHGIRPYAFLTGVLSVLTITFGAGPNNFGFDARLFATRLIDTSLGQAWLAAVHHPLPILARLAGVAAIAAIAIRLAPGSPRIEVA